MLDTPSVKVDGRTSRRTVLEEIGPEGLELRGERSGLKPMVSVGCDHQGVEEAEGGGGKEGDGKKAPSTHLPHPTPTSVHLPSIMSMCGWAQSQILASQGLAQRQKEVADYKPPTSEDNCLGGKVRSWLRRPDPRRTLLPLRQRPSTAYPKALCISSQHR